MPQLADEGKTVILRAHLREHTRSQHDTLDESVAHIDLSRRHNYANFLKNQLNARLAIERFVAETVFGENAPPATVPLLIDDLQAMGRPFSLPSAAFTLPHGADPIGLAWAMAGSHLGNRAMRAQIGGTALPTAFLDDPAMIAYWGRLRPRLQIDVCVKAADAAALAANAVFEHFRAVFGANESGQIAA